jgi:hypothetical protein
MSEGLHEVSHDVPDGGPAVPSGVHLPQPSIQPLVTGAGVAMLLFGVIAGPIFAGAGLLTLGLGIAGWIAELRAASPADGALAVEAADASDRAERADRTAASDRAAGSVGAKVDG